IWEVVDNSVDEAMAGHATGVNVTLLEDGGVEVVDDGRGIPVEMHESGMPTVQVVMTQLHAGGKFDSDSYAVSGGLHGVGISVVNALSTRVEVQIKRDGRLWNQDFHMAVPAELVDAGPATGSGTRVRFWADPDIFESTDYDFDVVARRHPEVAFLNKGLTITLTDGSPQAPDATDLDAIADTEGAAAGDGPGSGEGSDLSHADNAAESFGEGSNTDRETETNTATPADHGADTEAGAGSAGVRERKRTF